MKTFSFYIYVVKSVLFMYTREEAKTIREEFWKQFRSLSSGRRLKKKLPGKWVLTSTGIKALNLRFHVDTQMVQVGIDLETKNMDKRIELFEKLESVRNILETTMGGPMIWELDYKRENGKSVSRIYVQKDGINIYDRKTWENAWSFMYDHMILLEEFYSEYRDFLK